MFGQSFTPAGVAALSERSLDDRDQQILDGLVAKQVLGFNDDRLSSERGQYHFLQAPAADHRLRDAVAPGPQEPPSRGRPPPAGGLGRGGARARRGAGGPLPRRRRRRSRRLRRAADPRRRVRDARRRRASGRCRWRSEPRRSEPSTGRPSWPRTTRTRARLLDQAGRAALLNADYGRGASGSSEAVELFESLGDTVAVARSLAALARTLLLGRIGSTRRSALNRRAVAGLPDGSAEQAAALAVLASHLAFSGRLRARRSPRPSGAGDRRAARGMGDGRAGVQHARQRPRALRPDRGVDRVPGACAEDRAGARPHRDALRSYNNLANGPLQLDRFQEAREHRESGLALARRGDIAIGSSILGLMVATANVGLGQWDVALELAGTLRRHGRR